MADAAKPPGKIRRFFSAIAAFPGKVWGWSLPTKAAWVAGLALVAIVAVAWIVFLTDPTSVPWRHAMTPVRVLAVIALVLVIPWVVYHGLRMWLEGERSRFADIDFAWNAGLAALQKNGLDIRSIPLFLSVGSGNEQQEQSLMAASGLGLRVPQTPEGPAPLHWYANPDGIYLFCTAAGSLSALAALRDKQASQEMSAQLSSLEGPGQFDDVDPTGEMPVADYPQPSAYPPPQIYQQPAPQVYAQPVPQPMIAAQRQQPDGGDSIRGTLMLDQYNNPLMAQQAARQRRAAPAAPSGGQNPGDVRGTMMLQAPIVLQPQAVARVERAAAAPPPGYPPSGYQQPMIQPANYSQAPARRAPVYRTATVAPHDSAEALQRLQYVCRLLMRARSPLCPMNGVLTLLPLDSLQRGPQAVEEVQRGVKFDLRTLQRASGLRFPVTALVVGLENEAGFRELVRRVGRERALVQRFGQRFDVRSLATPEELAALCSHVTGAFEDWVYTLFREKEALTRPGNTRLYGLLCKVRCNLKQRLTDILAGGFGHDQAQEPDDEPLLFSGCYFAATGNAEDRQAFVKGVFDKLIQEQEDVEWTQRAQTADRRYRGVAYVGLALDAVLVLAPAGMILTKAFR